MKLIFPERGRNNQSPKDSYTSRLNSAVAADPHHVTWHKPEHRSDSIEPDDELVGMGCTVDGFEDESYMDGLRFGGEE